jgi:hypothetical protein
MSRRKKRNHYPGVVQRAPESRRKRSYEVPLLWLGAAAFIGFPILRDATADPMQRNRYGNDRYSCECDYGADRCSYTDRGWVGPWYAERAADRGAEDPGTGRCWQPRPGGSYYAGTGRPVHDAYRPPSGVERGYRGGFGGTGRIRAAGS